MALEVAYGRGPGVAWLAYRIMRDVVPKLLNPRVALPERVAEAHAWAIFLHLEAPRDPGKWDEERIMEVAEALARYARSLVDREAAGPGTEVYG